MIQFYFNKKVYLTLKNGKKARARIASFSDESVNLCSASRKKVTSVKPFEFIAHIKNKKKLSYLSKNKYEQLMNFNDFLDKLSNNMSCGYLVTSSDVFYGNIRMDFSLNGGFFDWETLTMRYDNNRNICIFTDISRVHFTQDQIYKIEVSCYNFAIHLKSGATFREILLENKERLL